MLFYDDSHVDVASTLYGKASYTSHGFARYTVNEILGKGHYGMVFLALNENSGKTYAVKVMKKKVRNINKDLKIQNILLTLEYHVRLIDFGLSKMGIHGDETTNSGCGTPFYMAPEILRRIAYGNEVDWWALGVVLYKIVTGTFPFMGKTNPEVFVAVTRDRPYYDPHLPSDLVAFFKGTLAGPKKGGSGRTKVRTTRRLSGSVPDVKEVLDMKDEKYKDTILNPRDNCKSAWNSCLP
nr:hypothetical protein BaRGS_005066 [Batillaria attramentaria]